MARDNSTIIGSSVAVFRLVFIMWTVFSVELFLQLNLGVFGIFPRTVFGLIGIVTAPILHGSFTHLVSNTIPILFLGTVLYYYYPKKANAVLFRCYFFTNIFVWLFARPSIHIGASGLVYGLASFLIFLGLFRLDFKSLFISIIVLFLYGGIFYGVLPSHPMISWESHLFGALVGLWTAVSFRRKIA